MKVAGSFADDYCVPDTVYHHQELVIARAYPAESAEIISTTDLSAYAFWPRSCFYLKTCSICPTHVTCLSLKS